MAGLLDGLLVADLSDDAPEDAGHLAGRILADLGADVIVVEPAGGLASRTADPLRFAAWNAGKRSITADDPALHDVLAAADIVLAGRGPYDDEAPNAVWVAVTAYGLTGPRAGWRGSDLSIVAAGGNAYPTGDPDRPPLRCTEPTSAAHTGPEAVVAALSALASGRPQVVDVSMAETVLFANMAGPVRYLHDHDRGRRRGAYTGRTRETWRCADGWVSFGLRGGPTRVQNLHTLTKLCLDDGLPARALRDRDWAAYDHRSASDDELRDISADVSEFFARHTMAELYGMAVQTGLMLAPANSPREICASEQLESRRFFARLGDVAQAPRTFVVAGPDPSFVDLRGDPPSVPRPSFRLGDHGAFRWRNDAATHHDQQGASSPAVQGGAWAGIRILELGSGAAGPVATGYFADQGATVIRIESKGRPDFLRSYTVERGNPDASPFFSALNPGKLSVSLNLKHPQAREVAERLVGWADVVAENFAPGAMHRLGLAPERLRALKPNLILASACLQGQTGPHREYPGFGGQGAALSGYTFLTGWPDRAPVGPSGTITDSLAPRFIAACIAAALLHRRRTGEGVDLDLSQVEAAAWTLSPWLMSWTHDGVVRERAGNRRPGACPHGAFRCAGEDRWVSVAVWSDDEWSTLHGLLDADRPDLATYDARTGRSDEVDELVTAWTQRRTPEEAAETLQAAGIDSYPLLDYADVHEDPQLRARAHIVTLHHPVLGQTAYERHGFRLGQAVLGPTQPAPTLGQHNRQVLCDLLGYTDDEVDDLDREGALS